MDDPFIETLWDIESDLMDDETKQLTPERRRELMDIFRTKNGEPSFNLLTYLVQCRGYTTIENFERWQEQFDAHVKWVDDVLLQPHVEKDECAWYYQELHLSLVVDLPPLSAEEASSEGRNPDWMGYKYKYDIDEPDCWTKYAYQWRSLPEKEDRAKEILRHYKKYEHKLKYGTIERVRKTAPKNPIEKAYSMGLMDSIATKDQDIKQLERYLKRTTEKNKIEAGEMQKKMEEYTAKKKAAQLKGTETTKQNKTVRKEKFCEIYRKEQAAHGKLYTKEALIQSAMERFNAENRPIKERTAWEYVKDLK